MNLMDSTLDNRDLNQSLLTHNSRYSVYVHPKNEFLHKLFILLPQVSASLSIGPLNGPQICL